MDHQYNYYTPGQDANQQNNQGHRTPRKKSEDSMPGAYIRSHGKRGIPDQQYYSRKVLRQRERAEGYE